MAMNESVSEMRMREIIVELISLFKEYGELKKTIPEQSRLHFTTGLIVSCWDFDNNVYGNQGIGNRHVVVGEIKELQTMVENSVAQMKYDEQARKLRRGNDDKKRDADGT